MAGGRTRTAPDNQSEFNAANKLLLIMAGKHERRKQAELTALTGG